MVCRKCSFNRLEINSGGFQHFDDDDDDDDV